MAAKPDEPSLGMCGPALHDSADQFALPRVHRADVSTSYGSPAVGR